MVDMDGIMDMGRDFGEHLKNLQKVFNKFRVANLKMEPKKYELFQKKIELLVHTVSVEGIQTSDSKIRAPRICT